MLRSWKLGSAFGIPLYVHPTFLLLPLWVFFQNSGLGAFGAAFSVVLVLAVFGCVLLHELGHALMARFFRIGTRDITLYPIGGVARLDRMTERPHEELCIALAGPAVNVGIALLLTVPLALAYLAGTLPGYAEVVARADDWWTLAGKFAVLLWFSNVVLVLFNLLPAFPMDGGRVLRAVLAGALGHLRATEIASRVGLVLAFVLALVAIQFGQPGLLLAALAVCFLGQQERQAVRHREARRRATMEDAPTAQGFTGVAWDASYRIWVRWHDGRPVAWWAPAE